LFLVHPAAPSFSASTTARSEVVSETLHPASCFLQERIAELEEKIEVSRRNAFTSDFTPSWFVLFKSQQAATMAASTRIYAEDSTQFQVSTAAMLRSYALKWLPFESCHKHMQAEQQLRLVCLLVDWALLLENVSAMPCHPMVITVVRLRRA
jgi:hypothetical protein